MKQRKEESIRRPPNPAYKVSFEPSSNAKKILNLPPFSSSKQRQGKPFLHSPEAEEDYLQGLPTLSQSLKKSVLRAAPKKLVFDPEESLPSNAPTSPKKEVQDGGLGFVDVQQESGAQSTVFSGKAAPTKGSTADEKSLTAEEKLDG